MSEMTVRENEMTVRGNETAMQPKRTPELIGSEIRMYVDTGRRVTMLCAIEIGRRLVEAKEMLDHGEWLPWLERETEFTDRSAQRYMKIFDEYGASQLGLFGPETNTTTLSDLPISKAFALLSLPESEREAFAEEVDAEHISVRELQQAIKEKQEAEKRAQEAEEQIAGAEKLRMAAEKSVEEKIEQLAAAKKQIAELENRPVEVAVERDEEAIKAAAESAKQQTVKEYEKTVTDLNARLLKIEKERDKLKAAADAGGAEADKKLEEANRETERIRAELEAARKQLKTSDADVTAFGLHYNYIQTEFGAMMAELKKVEERDGETAAKLRQAVTSLLEYFRKETAGEEKSA